MKLSILFKLIRLLILLSTLNNIRLSAMDLFSLQQLAEKQGIPNQTQIGSILHRYVTGDLK